MSEGERSDHCYEKVVWVVGYRGVEREEDQERMAKAESTERKTNEDQESA